MSYALKIYEAFKDDEERARVLSEAFDELEKRYPQIGDIATVQHLENERLRLQKEIEGVKLDVEKVRVELKETELRLTKEIEKVRLDLTKEIMEAKQSILRWLFGFWVTQATFVIGVIWVLLKVQ
jgi:predicted  nucleic acid-binding Zn-ribbon protein